MCCISVATPASPTAAAAAFDHDGDDKTGHTSRGSLVGYDAGRDYRRRDGEMDASDSPNEIWPVHISAEARATEMVNILIFRVQHEGGGEGESCSGEQG